jgi:hypothetical protein
MLMYGGNGKNELPLEGDSVGGVFKEDSPGVGVDSIGLVPVNVDVIPNSGMRVGVRLDQIIGVGISCLGGLLTIRISVLARISPSALIPPATKIRPSGKRVDVWKPRATLVEATGIQVSS